MQKMMCGDAKGYLVPKEEFDNKLRERFPILKNKPINRVFAFSSNGNVATILFDKKPLQEIEKGVLLSPRNESGATSELIVNMDIVRDIFGLENSINTIRTKFKNEKNKFAEVFQCLEVSENKRLFYFLSDEEDRCDCEMSEVKK